MPAHSEAFPWPSYYGHFNFFEARMREHNRVSSISYEAAGVYNLILHNNKCLRIFICECYSFGVAEFIEVSMNVHNIDAIIINSNWCGYTMEVKHHCRKLNVGVFNIADFMAALNRDDFWNHLDQREKESLKKY